MDKVQKRQSDQYSFPYHHLPQVRGRGFRSYRNWSWSINYIAATKLLIEQIKARNPAAHVDIGCGDGALVKHLADALPHVELAGYDYDEHAIAFASAFSPSLRFEAGDITAMPLERTYPSASLVEVLEHIPIDQTGRFLSGVRRLLTDDATLIITVPHRNKPVSPKHYQHFSFDSLRETLKGSFRVEDMFGFERLSGMQDALLKMLDNRAFFAEVHPVNRWLLNRQLHFRSTNERGCGRIFAIARPL